MKIVINTCYGCFNLKDEVYAECEIDYYGDIFDIRKNPKLIEKVENGEDITNPYSKLEVVEIPDDITDLLIEDNDGFENIIYVKNGRIHFA